MRLLTNPFRRREPFGAAQMADWLVERQYEFCAQLALAVETKPVSTREIPPLNPTVEAWTKLAREAYAAQLSVLYLSLETAIGSEDRFERYIERLVSRNQVRAARVANAKEDRLKHAALLGTALPAEKYQARVKVFVEATHHGFTRKMRTKMPMAVRFANRLVDEMKTDHRINRLTALSFFFAFQAMAPERGAYETEFMAWAPVLLRTWRPWRTFLLACPARFEELAKHAEMVWE